MAKYCKIISWFLWERVWLSRQVFLKHFRPSSVMAFRHLQTPVNTEWDFLKYLSWAWLVQPLLWNTLCLWFWVLSGHPCKYSTVVNLTLNQISPVLYLVPFWNACLWHFWFKWLAPTVVAAINLLLLSPFTVKKASKLLQFWISKAVSLGCWLENHVS